MLIRTLIYPSHVTGTDRAVPQEESVLKRFARLERRLQLAEGQAGAGNNSQVPPGFVVSDTDIYAGYTANNANYTPIPSTLPNNVPGDARQQAANALSALNASLGDEIRESLPSPAAPEGLPQQETAFKQPTRAIAGATAARRMTRKSISNPNAVAARSQAAYAAAANNNVRSKGHFSSRQGQEGVAAGASKVRARPSLFANEDS